MPADGRVFVVEIVVPDDAAPSTAKTHDINMLVLTGGRERTLDEYRSLFSTARPRAGPGDVEPVGSRRARGRVRA